MAVTSAGAIVKVPPPSVLPPEGPTMKPEIPTAMFKAVTSVEKLLLLPNSMRWLEFVRLNAAHNWSAGHAELPLRTAKPPAGPESAPLHSPLLYGPLAAEVKSKS